MKTRQGFVSNSSTSSFLLVGVRLTGRALYQVQRMYDEDEGLDGLTFIDGLLGVCHYVSDEDYETVEEINVEQAQKKIAKFLKKPTVKVKAFAGMYSGC